MILNLKSQTKLSGFYVVFNRTIENEIEGTYGISHFIEHLISHNFENELIEDFHSSGIEWNAYTSPTDIVFYITGLEKYVTEYRNIFLEKLFYLNINKEEFELEKSSLLEEYSSLFNIRSTSHLLNLYRKLLNSYSTIGKKENILNFNLDDSVLHYKKYFSIPSKIINISKDKYRNDNIIFNENKNDFILKYTNNENVIYEPYKTLLNKSSIIYFSPVILDNWATVTFINYMLSSGLSSPLYQNIRKKNGLAYYIKCNMNRLSDLCGINVISVETDDLKVDELISILEKTLKDKSFLTIEKFENIKKFILNKIETLDVYRYSNIDSFIKPDLWTLEKQINNMTFEDVCMVYEKHFNIDNYYKSVDKRNFKF
jgi:predicted Zn-dependent peptidase